MASPSPIFHIPPILHTILTHLDITTLLHSTRVNRTWNHLITTSSSLQRALFFLLSAPSPAILTTYDDFPPRYLQRVELNPLLVKAFPFFFPNSALRAGRDSFASLPWNRDTKSREAFKRQDASWRHMLLCSSPCGSTLSLSSSSRWGSIRTAASLCSSHEGLRMALLWDVLHSLVIEKRLGCPWFGIEWGAGEANTEAEGVRAEREWAEERAVRVEGEKGEIGIGVTYSWGCVQMCGSDLGEGFRSEGMVGLEGRGVLLEVVGGG